MPNLNAIIQKQNFQLILEAIGVILADELAGQAVLQPALKEFTGKVYSGRWIPFQHDQEEYFYNVLLGNGRYTGHTQIDRDGSYQFFIDCWASGVSDQNNKGDQNSMDSLYLMLGTVTSILSAPVYKTLGFTPGDINRSNVTDIQIAEPRDNRDTNHTKHGRVILSVDCHESSELQAGQLLAISHTMVKIEQTEKGHMYQVDVP